MISNEKPWLRLCCPSYQDQLFYASWSGDETCVKMLLDASATKDTTAWRLDNALYIATVFGHLETVTLLVREGADVNAEVERDNVLCAAVDAGRTDITALLIKEGADVNRQQGALVNALEVASRSGRLDIVELLIKQGADVNGQSATGTALCAASYSSHLNIVMHLVEAGADVNANGAYYGTPISAASATGSLDIITYLVEKGADVNAPTGSFENALQAAIIFQQDSVVNLLRNYKAELRYVDMSNLHCHVQPYCYRRLELIFHGRCNPDTSSAARKVPLHAMTQGKRLLKLVQLLVDHHANPNMLDASKMTRLRFASRRRRPITRIRYPLEHGADTRISYACGWVFLLEALKKRHIKGANIVLAYRNTKLDIVQKSS